MGLFKKQRWFLVSYIGWSGSISTRGNHTFAFYGRSKNINKSNYDFMLNHIKKANNADNAIILNIIHTDGNVLAKEQSNEE